MIVRYLTAMVDWIATKVTAHVSVSSDVNLCEFKVI